MRAFPAIVGDADRNHYSASRNFLAALRTRSTLAKSRLLAALVAGAGPSELAGTSFVPVARALRRGRERYTNDHTATIIAASTAQDSADIPPMTRIAVPRGRRSPVPAIGFRSDRISSALFHVIICRST
jgi:hypothetical protein